MDDEIDEDYGPDATAPGVTPEGTMSGAGDGATEPVGRKASGRKIALLAGVVLAAVGGTAFYADRSGLVTLPFLPNFAGSDIYDGMAMADATDGLEAEDFDAQRDAAVADILAPDAFPAAEAVEMAGSLPVDEDGTPAMSAETLFVSREAEIDARISDALETLPDGAEPLSAAETARLAGTGVVERQAAVGEDILIIDRELRRAEAIDKLISFTGVEGLREGFPEIYRLMEESPVVLRAEIERAELLADLEAARNPVPEEAAEDVAEQLRARDDGSSFFTSGETGSFALPEVSPDPVIVPSRILAEEVPEAQPIVYEPISLREIYGVGTDLRAVVTLGDERIRIGAGDELPQDTLVEEVGVDYIDVRREGETIRIGISG